MVTQSLLRQTARVVLRGLSQDVGLVTTSSTFVSLLYFRMIQVNVSWLAANLVQVPFSWLLNHLLYLELLLCLTMLKL